MDRPNGIRAATTLVQNPPCCSPAGSRLTSATNLLNDVTTVVIPSSGKNAYSSLVSQSDHKTSGLTASSPASSAG